LSASSRRELQHSVEAFYSVSRRACGGGCRGTPIDAEQAGCPGLVAAGGGQGGEQVAALIMFALVV
jgi:hypothetical protein